MAANDIIGPGFSENGIKFQDEKQHIIQNVKRILMTRRGEQVGNLSFGSDLKRYLYMPEMLISDVVAEIKNSIERCDPRIEVVECEFEGFDKDTEELNISLVINNKLKNETITTNLSV